MLNETFSVIFNQWGLRGGPYCGCGCCMSYVRWRWSRFLVLPWLFSAFVNVTGVAPSVMKYWTLLQPFSFITPAASCRLKVAAEEQQATNVTLMREGLHMCKNRANEELLQSFSNYQSGGSDQHIHLGNEKPSVRQNNISLLKSKGQWGYDLGFLVTVLGL